MADNFLTKVIFNELLNLHKHQIDVPFIYIDNMKNIFESRDMDHMFTNAKLLMVPAFKEPVNPSNMDSFWKEIKGRLSLLIYKLLNVVFPSQSTLLLIREHSKQCNLSSS